jgi:SNF2 family DNA or RNA helicase
MKLYRKVMKDKLFEVDGELVDARQQQKLRQVALQLAVNPRIAAEEAHVADNMALETARALLDSVNTEKTKVVMFANYNSSVEMLAAYFSKLNPAVIYGQNTAEKNRQNITKFQEDGTCRLMIANPIAGGVGIKAGDVSQTVIFFEPVSTPGQFDQAVSRVILKGQKEPVTVYILEILDTISPSLNELMLNKARTLLEVTKDKKSVYDNLLGKG